APGVRPYGQVEGGVRDVEHAVRGVEGGGRPGGVVGDGQRDGVDAERGDALGGGGVADDVPGVDVGEVHQRGLLAVKSGWKRRMYVVSSRAVTPHFWYCSCMTASASRSSSTPRPTPEGTGTAPPEKRSAPGATTSWPSCQGVCVSQAWVRLGVAAARWVMAARLMPRWELECIDSSRPNVPQSAATWAERCRPPQ